jgi:hypothetical protein
MGELLASLPATDVITASDQPETVTAQYWQAVGSSLSPPMTLTAETFERIKVTTIPRIYFFNSNGSIHDVIVGTVPRWTADSLREYLAR